MTRVITIGRNNFIYFIFSSGNQEILFLTLIEAGVKNAPYDKFFIAYHGVEFVRQRRMCRDIADTLS
jgi:hypothetical protein